MSVATRKQLKFEYTDVWGFKGALRGMRNPLESWDKSDTIFDMDDGAASIGANDMRLACNLIRGGAEERKFLRMIHVQADVTAPLFWWTEYDTYKVATVANSTSTMHRLGQRDLTQDDFHNDSWNEYNATTLDYLNGLVAQWREAKDEDVWRKLVEDLPRSFIYKRTIDLNYENILTILNQRDHHKLREWREDFCRWALSLPYMENFYLATKAPVKG